MPVPVFLGRAAGDLLKDLTEIFGTFIAHHLRDVVNAQPGISQQPLGLFHAHLGQVVDEIPAGFFRKKLAEVIGVQEKLVGQRLQRDVLCIMLLDVALDALYSVADIGRRLLNGLFQ